VVRNGEWDERRRKYKGPTGILVMRVKSVTGTRKWIEGRGGDSCTSCKEEERNPTIQVEQCEKGDTGLSMWEGFWDQTWQSFFLLQKPFKDGYGEVRRTGYPPSR